MLPSDRDAAVNSQSWEWLVDLPQRLDVVVELIDDRQTPAFPERSTPAATAIRRMISEREPALASAVDDVRSGPLTSRVAIDGYQALCLRLSPLGVVVVAREADQLPGDGWEDLDLVGSWIVNALEGVLTTTPNAPIVEPYRMASLQRMLAEAVPRGSVRKVVAAFVEALGVWDDVRVDVYAGGAAGGFFRFVSPMGAAASPAPREIDDRAVPEGHRTVRCSRDDAERMGIYVEPADVLSLRMSTGDVGWLLLFTGTIDGPGQVRLALYADMLREALNEVIATTVGRMVAAMTLNAIPANEPLADATQAVLGQLMAAVAGSRSALAVAAATGRQTLAVGEADLLHAPADRARPDRLIVTSSDPRSLMTVAIERDTPAFTAYERAVVQAGVTALHPRVQAAIQASTDGERRRQFRPVDSLFDQLASETVRAGQPASVIVVSVNPAAVTPGLLYGWLVKIREQLRVGDYAGILSHTEIAVLLGDASADQASVVSARLKELLQPASADSVVTPAFRTTTWLPNSTFDGSLVGSARAAVAAAF